MKIDCTHTKEGLWKIFCNLPAAFFAIIELTIKGMQLTVAVTSLAAYIFLSAGTISLVWLAMQQPTSEAAWHIWAVVNLTMKSGIDSSLSRVPPEMSNKFSNWVYPCLCIFCSLLSSDGDDILEQIIL